MLLVGDKTEKVHFSSKSEAGDGGSGKAGDGGDGGSGKAGDGGSGKADDGGSGKADDGGSGKADDGGSGKADDGGSGKADDGGSGKADDGGSGKADDGGSGKADDGGSGKADDGGSGEADDGGDGGSGKADGGGSGKADDGGSGQADDGGSEDDYKPNEDPQSTWFKVVKLLITRFVYKVAKRSCERSVNRQKKFISFMNASQAHKLHLLKKATGKDSEFVKYTGLKEACRDFAETYTSFLIWLALGSFTLISTGWELHSSSQMEKGLASLRVEMNNNNSVVSEVKKEMTSKDASYMHRFEEITRISNQKLEDLEKKIDLLLASKK